MWLIGAAASDRADSNMTTGGASPGRRGAAGRGSTVLGAAMVAAGITLATGAWPIGGESSAAAIRARPEVAVTPMDLRIKASNNSPTLAVDPTDERFVVLANRQDAPFSCSLHLSGNGGRSWITATPALKLPDRAATCYGPEVAFDRFGKLYFLFVGLAAESNRPIGIFLTTSDDRGRSFTAPRQVLGAERFFVRMVLDPEMGKRGRIHLVWLHALSPPSLGGLPVPANPIMASYSDDGGSTFSDPVQISDPARERVVAPTVALGSGHSIHVLYYDLEQDARDYHGLEGPTWEGTWSLVIASSRDGGVRFGEGVVVEASVVPPERPMLIFTMPAPSLAADRSGNLYAGWHDARNEDWDVFVRRSKDGGRRWDLPRRVNDDRRGNGRHQYLPRLSVGPDGRLDAVFYDRRGNVENRGNDVYYTYSHDRGVTFARNMKLTAQNSDSIIGPRYATSPHRQFEFGGRLGLISEPDRAVAAWTDTRNSGRGPPAQDIFATEVAFRTPASRPIWTRPTGAALTLAGAALLVVCRRRSHRARHRQEETFA